MVHVPHMTTLNLSLKSAACVELRMVCITSKSQQGNTLMKIMCGAHSLNFDNSGARKAIKQSEGGFSTLDNNIEDVFHFFEIPC